MIGTRIRIALIVIYALIGIVTFGHAAALQEAEHRQLKEACVRATQPCVVARENVIPSAFSAILWPLYWSWRIQR